ncbi:hypothetical protein [Streptomyces glaucescens]|uniref:Uncharacterized protein n=1 Tax=Streptomyces glaucescens TaxID=1907 RepID=A0A089X666_STRGA|nr:hypothetical protein [Streptomyces glaucescens]AIR97341.1 hypothetical protein SGLAU_06625 [Streptomyces glaucescens]
MSTDASRAPVPPRPAAPPAPGTPEPSADRRTTGPSRTGEPGPAPRRPGQAPLAPPPPPASARFPDLPPPPPRGPVPPRSADTPAERTTRLRPVPAEPSPAPDTGRVPAPDGPGHRRSSGHPAPTGPAAHRAAASAEAAGRRAAAGWSAAPGDPGDRAGAARDAAGRRYPAPGEPEGHRAAASAESAGRRAAAGWSAAPGDPGDRAGAARDAAGRRYPAPGEPDGHRATAPAQPADRRSTASGEPAAHRTPPATTPPDAPAPSWSAPPAHGLAMPHTHDVPGPLGGRVRRQTVAAAACVVLGLGLIGGAVTGSWLAGDPAGTGERGAFATAAGLWHNLPVDRLFPPTVAGRGAGPGGADRTWTRIAVAPDGGCADAFDPLLRKALAPAGCDRLLRATYTDATQSHVTTVGLLFTGADAAGMRSLERQFEDEGLYRRTDLMPRPYAPEDTVAAAFGPAQRASWTLSVLTDAPVVVYAVSGWADGRAVDDPQPAADATRSGATSAPAQAGLGHEAKGLADRIERGLRAAVAAATEQPS